MAKKFSSEEERKAWQRERVARQRAKRKGVAPVAPKDVAPSVAPLKQYETILNTFTILPPLETEVEKAFKKIPDVKHIRLSGELIKEQSVQSWPEEGPIMLEGIPTSEQIKGIVSLIKAKHGGKISYVEDKGRDYVYRRWVELCEKNRVWR